MSDATRCSCKKVEGTWGKEFVLLDNTVHSQLNCFPERFYDERMVTVGGHDVAFTED